MSNGLDDARERRNWLERLVDKIPGFRSYQNRELRREVDKIQRDWLADQVDRGRQAVQEKIRDWSRGGNLANLDLAASLEKLLDRLANRIRHADYGSAGFFDAVKIGEDELEALYQFDLELSVVVERLADGIDELSYEASELELRNMLKAVLDADTLFDERATCIEDVTRKGGR